VPGTVPGGMVFPGNVVFYKTPAIDTRKFMSSENVQSILDFWFGKETTAKRVNHQKSALWWSKNEGIDREIKERFGRVTEDVLEGKKRDWLDSPGGMLASIICVDQFSRNMYRGQAKCFSYDHCSIQIAKLMLAKGFDNDLTPIQRSFAFLPFEHSEKLEDQEKSLELYASLVDEVSAESREIFDRCYQYALEHHEIIERFGRFPHRNIILERQSTPEELEFLDLPGSSF
jgi:uncharacterized protein (DUF924 family)